MSYRAFDRDEKEPDLRGSRQGPHPIRTQCEAALIDALVGLDTTPRVASMALLGAAIAVAMMRRTQAPPGLELPSLAATSRSIQSSSHELPKEPRPLKKYFIVAVLITTSMVIIDACSHVVVEVAVKSYGLDDVVENMAKWSLRTDVNIASLALIVLLVLVFGLILGVLACWAQERRVWPALKAPPVEG